MLQLHEYVFEYLREYITFKEQNMNNYLLVRNNYMPLDSLADLNESTSDALILITKNQFTAMVNHIKNESDKLHVTPIRRFAQALKD